MSSYFILNTALSSNTALCSVLCFVFVVFALYFTIYMLALGKRRTLLALVCVVVVLILINGGGSTGQQLQFLHEYLTQRFFNLDTFYYLYLTLFVAYFVTGLFLFFYWGTLGVMGIFLISEYILGFFFIFSFIALYFNISKHTAMSIILGELYLAEDFVMINCVTFDLLSILGTMVVGLLTLIVLTFGVEYMLREALAYNVIATLMLFSANIVWFIVSFSFGLMTIFWEFSGIFSLMLVDMYYSRVRTTQAVSRTFAIGRFSDFWMFIASIEIFSLCKIDSLAVLFNILPVFQFELSVVAGYVFDITCASTILFSIFTAAACKCAQFVLFVWLPDAMEAPTPASALIHSSTLVVMGIFLILRFAPVLHTSLTVLYLMSFFGGITVAYGAIFSIQTSDLKKAVAYSTISQIGYLFCGCGCLAYKEVLFYLIVHALCKAMLFIFVGYIVHIFGGTTSLRKMGGIFYIVPDIAIYVFILCIILAGAPYTVGFFAKELIVNHLLSGTSPVSSIVLFCWMIAFVCTPIYLYRICILPLFGRPRSSRKVYRNIAKQTINFNFCESDGFNTNKTFLLRFSNHIQRWVVQNRLMLFIHFVIIMIILFCGEFLALLLTGFFATSSQLFSNTVGDIHSLATLSLYLNSFYLIRNVQFLIVILFITVTLYFVFMNNQFFFSTFLHCVGILLLIVLLSFLLLEGSGLFLLLAQTNFGVGLI